MALVERDVLIEEWRSVLIVDPFYLLFTGGMCEPLAKQQFGLT
jgi:hypothetical protein